MSMTTKSSAWSGTSRSTDPGFDSAALPRSALPPRGTPKTDWRAVLSNEVAQVSLIGVVISHEGALYVYGGLIGRVHAHSIENTSPGFRRLVLSPGRTWEKLARGPRLRGTALAADGAAIDHRIGGWELRGPPFRQSAKRLTLRRALGCPSRPFANTRPSLTSCRSRGTVRP